MHGRVPNTFYILIDHGNFQYMQDGAPAHTTRSSKAWFEEKNIPLMDWCPRSPDLNPIENVWAYMDKNMARTHITSITHLKTILQETWLSVPQEYCEKLICSMPNRVNACIKNKGGHFKY